MMRFLVLALWIFGMVGICDLHSADNRVRFVRVGNSKYVFLRDVANYYGMTLTPGHRTVTMQSKWSKIVMTFDKQNGSINNQSVVFFQPPVLRNGEILIGEQDFINFIDPILRDRSLPPMPVRTIMLDAGHGGNDIGGKGKLYLEKELALSLVHKIKFYLGKMGYRVLLTRSTDVFIPLEGRVDMCRRYKADLFISIHTNAAENRSVCGIETFVMPPAGVNSTYGARDLSYEDNNKFDRNNSRLGYELHKAMLDKTNAFDRGFKRARFFVLKNATCPAVLLEVGFISNRFEERRLGENAYQDQLAEAIAGGIANYAKLVSR